MECRRLTLVESHPTSGDGWVYVWLWDGLVRYVGATWLDPAARVEAHLHGVTDDPRSLALRAAVEGESVGPEIRAFSVPVGSDRQAFRKGLILACEEAGLLAEGFIGGRDGSEVQAATDQSWVRQVLNALTAPG